MTHPENKAPLVCGTVISGTFTTVLFRTLLTFLLTGLGEVRGAPPFIWAPTHFSTCLAIGTNMQYAQCPYGSVNAACQAAFLGIHLTSQSSAYFEVCSTQ